MSNISPKPDQSTSAESAVLTNLAALAASGVGEFIRKTGLTTFENAVPAGGGGGGNLIVGTTAISSGASGRILYDNAGVLGEMTTTGSGTVVALATSPSFTTPALGVATATSINGNAITTGTGTLTLSSFTLTVAGTASVTGTNTGDQTTVSGNAGTATALQNARTIGGVSFDGTANITVASATGGFTVSGGNLALGTNSLTLTGSVGATGARATKVWATDMEVTNAIVGSVTGNAATATALQTARAINGTNFDGTAAITITAAAGTLTGNTLNSTVVASSLTSVGTLTSLTLGGTLAMGANSITMTGSLAATGARVTKGWFTDLEVSNAPTLGGTAATGSGGLVLATTPTLVTPVLGVATATSINKVAFTAPATSATLTILNGKTLTVNNSITLAGTDSTTMTFPSTSATIARTDAAQTFTGKQTFGANTGTLTTDSDGATVTFDLDASNLHTVVLGGNRTLALSNASVGQTFTLILVQDGTGSRTVTWFSTIKWAGGSAPTLTTTLNKADAFTFICYSSGNYYGTVSGINF